ncbi:MAG TPA: hypothetical protein VG389_25210 [Myxococcota bacterium]|jgi:hypothetical protein|nr:hypothetical protein [Myxococcota bacterium]
MGSIILRKAAVEAIEEVVAKTLQQARQRDDQVRGRVEAKLGPHEPAIEAARAEQGVMEARAGDAHARATYLADRAAQTVGEVADEIWNALDRPGADVTYAMLLPGGVAFIKNEAPARQAVLMRVLAEKLRKTQDARLEQTRLDAWAERVEEGAGPLWDAAVAALAAEGRAYHARQARAHVVRTAWRELPRLKRELLNEGWSEADIHRVIPDAQRGASGAGGGGGGGTGTGTGTGTGAAVAALAAAASGAASSPEGGS